MGWSCTNAGKLMRRLSGMVTIPSPPRVSSCPNAAASVAPRGAWGSISCSLDKWRNATRARFQEACPRRYIAFVVSRSFSVRRAAWAPFWNGPLSVRRADVAPRVFRGCDCLHECVLPRRCVSNFGGKRSVSAPNRVPLLPSEMLAPCAFCRLCRVHSFFILNPQQSAPPRVSNLAPHFEQKNHVHFPFGDPFFIRRPPRRLPPLFSMFALPTSAPPSLSVPLPQASKPLHSVCKNANPLCGFRGGSDLQRARTQRTRRRPIAPQFACRARSCARFSPAPRYQPRNFQRKAIAIVRPLSSFLVFSS